MRCDYLDGRGRCTATPDHAFVRHVPGVGTFCESHAPSSWPSRGEIIVVAVRATALSDTLRVYLAVPSHPGAAAAVDWQAQRLASACDRALGTRTRPYDHQGGGTP